jgi:hypothetical protein
MDNTKFDRLKALQPEIQGEVKCNPAMLRELDKFVYPPKTETFVSKTYGLQLRYR